MYKEGLKCVLYIRVSTEMQVDGYSLDAQKTVLTQYADREGMSIIKIYTDAGKSGKSIEGRPAFCELLEDVSNGLDIDFVLVYKLSRFGRSAVDILNSMEYLQSYDINLIAMADGIDSSQASGKLMISVLSALSEMERDNIEEQTMNGRKERARQGFWGGGFAPFGYKVVNGVLEVVEEEAEIVKIIYNLFTEKNMGITSIAVELNHRGILKPIVRANDKHNTWHAFTIKRILSSPLYMGKIIYLNTIKKKIKGSRNQYKRVKTGDPIISDGKHKSIISEEQWLKAKSILDSNKANNPGHSFKPKYLVSGLLVCPICGKKLAVKYTKKDSNGNVIWHEFGCMHLRSDRAIKCSNRKRIVNTKIDPYISNLIIDLIKSNKLENLISENIKSSNNLLEVKKSITNIENIISDYEIKRDNLEEDIDALSPRDSNYEKIRKRYNERLTKIYEKIDDSYKEYEELKTRERTLSKNHITKEKVLKCIENFEMVFNEMTIQEKGDLLRLFIKNINFDYESGKIKSIDFKFPVTLEGRYKDKHTYFETTYEVLDSPSFLVEYDMVIVETNSIIPTIRNVRSNKYIRKCATYKEIISFVREKFGLCVSTGNVAEVKRDHGLSMQVIRLDEKARHPGIPPEKRKAIEEALKHFNMISN